MKNAYYYYVALNLSSYAAIGMLLPLLGQYLDFLEFSGQQIGTVTSLATATAIFATTFWGEKYANSSRKKNVVIFLCILSAIIGVGLLACTSYWAFLVGFMVLYFFQSPVMGLNDAMTIESGQPFSAIRKWGCIGFALATFLQGAWLERWVYLSYFPCTPWHFCSRPVPLFLFCEWKNQTGMFSKDGRILQQHTRIKNNGLVTRKYWEIES